MIYLVLMAALLTGCTFNVSMAHTTGTAEDVIDDNASNTPTVTASIPANLCLKSSRIQLENLLKNNITIVM